MHHLLRLADSIQAAGSHELAASVRQACRWERGPLPYRIRDEAGTWRVGHHATHGWCAVLDQGDEGEGERVITSDGELVDPDAPPDGHHTIRLPAAWWSALSVVGEGNASQALRDAVLGYLREQGRVRGG